MTYNQHDNSQNDEAIIDKSISSFLIGYNMGYQLQKYKSKELENTLGQGELEMDAFILGIQKGKMDCEKEIHENKIQNKIAISRQKEKEDEQQQ